MSKQLYTNADLFYVILNRLKEKNLLPSILDYSLGERYNLVNIKSDEWDCISRVNFGGSEGIYLDLYIEGNIDGSVERAKLGTFKTLEESKDAYKTMADLGVEFVFELREFVEQYSDSFCWTGYTLRFVTDEKSSMCLWCGTKKRTIDRIKRFFSRHNNDDSTIAVVINNETDKKTTYRREDIILE